MYLILHRRIVNNIIKKNHTEYINYAIQSGYGFKIDVCIKNNFLV